MTDYSQTRIPSGFVPIWDKHGELTGYFVGRCGNVWSAKTKQMLSLRIKHGYPCVVMRIAAPTHGAAGRRLYRVHRLVGKAFLPNPEGHPLLRHLNDVKTDNRVENLKWGTHRENMADAVRNGRFLGRAGLGAMFPLSEGFVMWQRHKDGETLKTIGESYGVSHTTVANYIQRARAAQRKQRALTGGGS